MFLINAFEPPRAFEIQTGEALLVGRGEYCDIRLDDPSVSRVHCRAIVRDGRVVLSDAGSRWGTFVNGERVEQADLKPGDRVRVGETLLIFSAEADSGATTIAPVEVFKGEAFEGKASEGEADLKADSDPAPQARVRNRSEEGSHHTSSLPIVDRFAQHAGPSPVGSTPEANSAIVPPHNDGPRDHRPAPAERLDSRPFVPARFLGSQFLRYQIESLLSHSRSGLAFVANDPALQRKVVIKFYRPDLLNSKEAVARFLRAVRTMINFRHPNIVRLFDAGQADGLCYTITEHIDGITAEKAIRDVGIAGMLDWKTTTQIGLDLCDALEELHAAGVVHRDIRPSHILIEHETRRALIGELVLAKAWDRDQVEQLTAAGDVVGDLSWQAPEQLSSGEPADHRTDLYQLGLTLYVLLTAGHPFRHPDAASTVRSVLEGSPASPKSVQLSIPDLLSDTILRALAGRPADRYAGANDLASDLKRAKRFATV